MSLCSCFCSCCLLPRGPKFAWLFNRRPFGNRSTAAKPLKSDTAFSRVRYLEDPYENKCVLLSRPGFLFSYV